MGGQLLVGVSHGVDLVLDEGSVEWVEEDALGELSGGGDSDGAAHDGGWHDDVVEELLVHSLEGSASWALLGGVSVSSLGLDGSLGNNNDWVLELVLEGLNNGGVDLLEVGEGAEWNSKENVLSDGAVSLGVLNLLGARDEDESEGGSDILGGAGLKSGEGLGGLLLEVSWLSLHDEYGISKWLWILTSPLI